MKAGSADVWMHVTVPYPPREKKIFGDRLSELLELAAQCNIVGIKLYCTRHAYTDIAKKLVSAKRVAFESLNLSCPTLLSLARNAKKDCVNLSSPYDAEWTIDSIQSMITAASSAADSRFPPLAVATNPRIVLPSTSFVPWSLVTGVYIMQIIASIWDFCFWRLCMGVPLFFLRCLVGVDRADAYKNILPYTCTAIDGAQVDQEPRGRPSSVRWKAASQGHRPSWIPSDADSAETYTTLLPVPSVSRMMGLFVLCIFVPAMRYVPMFYGIDMESLQSAVYQASQLQFKWTTTVVGTGMTLVAACASLILVRRDIFWLSTDTGNGRRGNQRAWLQGVFCSLVPLPSFVLMLGLEMFRLIGQLPASAIHIVAGAILVRNVVEGAQTAFALVMSVYYIISIAINLFHLAFVWDDFIE